MQSVVRKADRCRGMYLTQPQQGDESEVFPDASCAVIRYNLLNGSTLHYRIEVSAHHAECLPKAFSLSPSH